MVAIHAAAAAAKARARVLDAFRIHGATAPERARPLAELGLAGDDRTLGAFISSGVVRGVDARGRTVVLGDDLARAAAYYLDEAAFVAQRDRIPENVKAKLVIVSIVLAIITAALFVMMARS